MIAYLDIEAKIKKRLGATYVNDTHNASAIKEYVNDAIEKISETILRNNFIFEYTFTATGDRNEYPIPIQHSTKQIFSGDIELIQFRDWVVGAESINNPSKIAIYPDTFFTPDSADTKTYTLLYRGVPTLVDLDVPETLNINLPRPYARAIIPLACYFAFLDVKQTEMATEQLNFYREEISSIAGAFADPDENNYKRMSGNHKF